MKDAIDSLHAFEVTCMAEYLKAKREEEKAEEATGSGGGGHGHSHNHEHDRDRDRAHSGDDERSSVGGDGDEDNGARRGQMESIKEGVADLRAEIRDLKKMVRSAMEGRGRRDDY